MNAQRHIVDALELLKRNCQTQEAMELYKVFVFKMRELFGEFDVEHRRFQKASNSEIARELGYSDAQFSRLINESATEGEYHRVIQNADRILTIIQLKNQLQQGNERRKQKPRALWFMLTIIFCTFTSVLVYLLSILAGDSTLLAKQREPSKDYTLQWSFESPFVNPYVKLEHLPDDCQYPCYKYQGKWELKEEYKIPLFGESSGFHYTAVSVTLYARCMSEREIQRNITRLFSEVVK